MTDQTVAPEGEGRPVTDEASAIAHVERMLTPEPEAPEPEAEAEQAEATDGADEAEEAAPKQDTDAEVEAADSEADSSDEGEVESVEVPSTINELAEQWGVDVNDLAAHLTVKVDGEDVPLADLRDGHLRRSDFTRRMQEVSDERNAVQAEREQMQGHMAQRLEQLDTLVINLERQISEEAQNLNRLLDENPAEYLRTKARIDEQKALLEQTAQWRHQQMETQKAEQAQRMKEYRAEQQEQLVRAMPDLKDANKVADFERTIASYLEKAQGFTPAEVEDFFNGPWDHRQILILRDAANYSQFKAGEKKLTKKIKTLPKVQKPGTVRDRRERAQDDRTEARDRLRRRGDDASAQEYMKTLLG